MIPAIDSYKISAKYYDDAYTAKQDLHDLPFYLDLARQSGGPVLELACGTGRILLPIARQGIAVHGVDNSAPMLDVLKSSLKHEPKDVRELVSIVHGDLRSLRSHRNYPLVIIPFRPLQHMYTLDDQINALKTAAYHLDGDGLLAFDVFYPKYDMIFSGIGAEKLELEWTPAAEPGTIMRRYFRKEAVDKVAQTFTATFIYRAYQNGRLIREETEPLKMSWYTYPHLRVLFLLAGLEIVEEYGSFAKAPLDNNAEQMIFLLKARSGFPAVQTD